MTSNAPPAANGTMMVTGRVGQSCAGAGAAAASSVATAAMILIRGIPSLACLSAHWRRGLNLHPPPLAGEGWGGGELARMNLFACPLPVPPPQAGEGIAPSTRR